MEDKIDYASLGLKCGLEIHQQIDTKKLFCSCPSLLRNDEPDFTIQRSLHAVAGEAGKVDVAAKHEAEKGNKFIYQGYSDTTCLIELDEEPPHEINQEALKIALQISLLLNCKIQTITQIMRKTVIDGSNTSGFQRTVLIAQDGFIETSQGKVGIASICLEEDAARIVSRNEDKNEVVYRLDRLGIPLVEIATSPDIKTPEQAKETALKLGAILRTCRVKRGLGTIRQDVNMSLKNGKRIEIKGFQDIKQIEKVIENETKRQIKLVKEKKSVSEVRQALENNETKFLRPMPGSARMYPETDLPLIKISRDLINEVKKSLPKVKLREEIEEELRKVGLHQEMIKLLLKREKVDEFKELLSVYNKADLIVKMLLIFPKEILTKEKKNIEEVEEKLNSDVLIDILNALKSKKIHEGNIKDIMLDIVEGKTLEEAVKTEKIDVSEFEEKILKIIKSKPGLNPNAYMGLVMGNPELKGKIDGKTAMEIIQKLVS